MLTRPPERLTDEERAIVRRLLDADETVSAAYTLVQRFRTALKAKDAEGMETWLADAQSSGIPSLAGVANGMLADHAAVAAAVTEPWSNGTVEGHVHKVKPGTRWVQRQGYGRAAFALLRLRLLAAYPTASLDPACRGCAEQRMGTAGRRDGPTRAASPLPASEPN